MKILIVDDVNANITVISEIFKNDYSVFVATNGHDAFLRAKKQQPNIILSDVQMPGIDGYELLRRLRADDSTKEIPFIFVTSQNSEREKEYGLSAGAVDYITKPINRKEIIASVKKHLA